MSNPPLPHEISEAHMQQFRLRNQAGFEVVLLNYGASIQSVRVPAPGGFIDAVLGYAEPMDYLADPYFMGVTAGRYANRIENARLHLDGQVFRLQETPGAAGHCLHGGEEGFSRRYWRAEKSEDEPRVSFTLVSVDGDQGFPGRVTASVTYRLLDDWKLMIDFRAITDSTTVINLVNHAYFNLNRDGSPIDNHQLLIHADRFTPLEKNMIPTGEKRSVEGSNFDFREPASIAERLDFNDNQIRIGRGFDHNFILNGAQGVLRLAATAWSPQSGLKLDVLTTQPGLQLYTGEHLGQPFQSRAGFCLETQGFPNAPNTPGFPSTILEPGMTYRQQTIYGFSMKD